MSGHSKWAQIKRQKGVADIKRGQSFTKLSNAITIAVRESRGVTNPDQNFRLRLAIDRARDVNMPKENIDRAIQRASGKQAEELKSVVYEAFGPGGISLIIEAATDNKLRTTSEVKNVLEKNGVTLGTPGAVSYQFLTKGLIIVKKNNKTVDDIFLEAADAGAEDIEEAGDEVFIYTKPDELGAIRDLVSKNLQIVSAELTRKPSITVSISDKETAKKILRVLGKIENLDDVQKIYSNFDIPDELIKE
ncbi:MAG: YebC/PmpR family DNA-binding transcriptional regulator [Candidatus Levybacteria bacterium]|nr:YebC/PmpR family DNA-binding transcriptional regulator [Candidatus Levybacteria bacterium]